MGKEGNRTPSEREQAIAEALSQPGIAEGLREVLRPPISHEEVLEQGGAAIKGVFDRLEEEYPDIMRQFKKTPDPKLTSDLQE